MRLWIRHIRLLMRHAKSDAARTYPLPPRDRIPARQVAEGFVSGLVWVLIFVGLAALYII